LADEGAYQRKEEVRRRRVLTVFSFSNFFCDDFIDEEGNLLLETLILSTMSNKGGEGNDPAIEEDTKIDWSEVATKVSIAGTLFLFCLSWAICHGNDTAIDAA
jgi:hypothetical protein